MLYFLPFLFKGPEELAAGISRLSVIEESSEIHKMASGGNDPPPPNLSQYFGSSSLATSGGSASTSVAGGGGSAKKTDETKDEEFFDNFSNKNISDDDAVMQSCRESRLDLSNVDLKKPTTGKL